MRINSAEKDWKSAEMHFGFFFFLNKLLVEFNSCNSIPLRVIQKNCNLDQTSVFSISSQHFLNYFFFLEHIPFFAIHFFGMWIFFFEHKYFFEQNGTIIEHTCGSGSRLGKHIWSLSRKHWCLAKLCLEYAHWVLIGSILYVHLPSLDCRIGKAHQ